ncbi:MAG: acyltransferase [Clostridia bacterium]|nr:acyltransferase [Clostridia bacterium]
MERNVLVDKLKGYACFLVLLGHVIMGIRLSGISVPFFFEGTEQFLWSFHVALFMFLSGVVYKETGGWTSKKTKGRFILNKLLNLGIPYVVFSAVYIIINSFVGEANTHSSVADILFIWKTPVAQYWFLYALFFLFVIWVCLSGILKNWQITLFTVLLGYVLPLIPGFSWGPFDIVFYSALAFGLGTSVDFKSLTKTSAFIKYLTVAMHLAVSITLIVFGLIEKAFIKEIMTLFGIYSSISFIYLLQDIKPVSRFLLFINKYSFQTYLLHTIFTAGARVMLLRAGVSQWWIHLVLGTLCGIAFSVLASIIAKKIKVLNIFFFPTKTVKSLQKQQ